MPKRLYYDCPLKVTYMMLEFGVRVIVPKNEEADIEQNIEDCEKITNLPRSDEYRCVQLINEVAKKMEEGVGRAYVCPDSEGIFLPKPHDLVMVDLHDLGNKIACFVDGVYNSTIVVYHCLNRLKRFEDKVKREDCTIIQRDGKAFITPKEERWQTQKSF